MTGHAWCLARIGADSGSASAGENEPHQPTVLSLLGLIVVFGTARWSSRRYLVFGCPFVFLIFWMSWRAFFRVGVRTWTHNLGTLVVGV
jgi:hypothetical protein